MNSMVYHEKYINLCGNERKKNHYLPVVCIYINYSLLNLRYWFFLTTEKISLKR